MGISRPKIVAVVGPTASGKSSLGIKLAKQFSGEIIAVDSRTVYCDMNIGTAKPQKEEDGITHWGTDLIDPDQEYSGALFKEYADEEIREIIERDHLPILVGGTGLWMDIVLGGLEMTGVEPQPALRKEFEMKTCEELFEEYKVCDPVGAEVIDRANKRRLVRALEVCRVTGEPFSSFKKRSESLYDVLWLGVSVEKEVLHNRIDKRIDEMIDSGLIDEVRMLVEKYGEDAPGMTGIGYRQFIPHIKGEVSLEEAIEQLKKDTKQYAKRQMTWFKRNKNIHWVKSRDEVGELVKTFL